MSWAELLHGVIWVAVIYSATSGGPVRLYAVGWRWIEGGKPAAALQIGRLLVLVPVGQYLQLGSILLLRANADLGRTARAVRAARRFVKTLHPHECQWFWLNHVVDVLVSAGRYREAVEVQGRWSARARDLGRDTDPMNFAVTQINRAEAFFNLGETEEALALLEQVRAAVESDPFTRNGHVCLHAWISIHEGGLERARELLARLELEPLSPVYAAEVHFTRAAFERELGNLDLALEHAEHGLTSSVRPSSERNGLFMIASIEALRGNDARAKEYFERAVRHRYRGQGADGLFRYAEFLETTTGRAAADAVYQLLIERDGESVLATRRDATRRAS